MLSSFECQYFLPTAVFSFTLGLSWNVTKQKNAKIRNTLKDATSENEVGHEVAAVTWKSSLSQVICSQNFSSHLKHKRVKFCYECEPLIHAHTKCTDTNSVLSKTPSSVLFFPWCQSVTDELHSLTSLIIKWQRFLSMCTCAVGDTTFPGKAKY